MPHQSTWIILLIGCVLLISFFLYQLYFEKHFKAQSVITESRFTYTNLVSDGTNSIQLEFTTQTLVDGEKVIVIYRGEVTNPTYKVIK